MAVLHKKEEKIQAVLGRLPKKYNNEEFVAMFIKLYSKDWGKIKSAYIKQSQDREPGTVINMPKPDLYLKQVLDIFLKNQANFEIIKEEPLIITDEPKVVKEKAVAKKKIELEEPKKVKAAVKKKVAIDDVVNPEESTEAPKKAKTPTKKKAATVDDVLKPKKTVSKKVKEEKK